MTEGGVTKSAGKLEAFRPETVDDLILGAADVAAIKAPWKTMYPDTRTAVLEALLPTLLGAGGGAGIGAARAKKEEKKKGAVSGLKKGLVAGGAAGALLPFRRILGPSLRYVAAETKPEVLAEERALQEAMRLAGGK